jgi:hypothetical protein
MRRGRLTPKTTGWAPPQSMAVLNSFLPVERLVKLLQFNHTHGLV